MPPARAFTSASAQSSIAPPGCCRIIPKRLVSTIFSNSAKVVPVMVPQVMPVEAKEIAMLNNCPRVGVFISLMTEQPDCTMLAKQPIGPGINPASPNRQLIHLLSQNPVLVRWVARCCRAKSCRTTTC